MDGFIWAGAEIPSNRTTLYDAGVRVMGVSYKGLVERVHRPVGELLANFPDDVEIHALPGAAPGDPVEHVAGYESFVEACSDRLSSWVEVVWDDPDGVRSRRSAFYESLDDECFRPVWDHSHGVSVLELLSELYPHVAVTADSAKAVAGLAGLLNTMRRKHGTLFHGLPGTDVVSLREPGAPPYELVYTGAWMAPMRNGETVVWDGNRLHRYPKKMKDQVRAQHRVHIEALGVDSAAVVADEGPAVTALAIKSLMRYEDSLAEGRVLSLVPGSGTGDEPGGGGAPPRGVPRSSDVEARHDERSPARLRHPSTKRLLPTVGHETATVNVGDPNSPATVEDVTLIRHSGRTQRMCDTCFIASNCPEFDPGHECAFHFSPNVRTTAQLRSMLHTVIEHQTERVFFSRMVEEVNGGYPDPAVGKEMDRLMSQVKTMKDLEQNNEFVRLTVERQTSGGILSQIFGEKAKNVLAPPETPTD